MTTKQVLVDMFGVPIKPFDLLKMYHFTGARRKKYYMYKWVLEKEGRLFACHLDRNGIESKFLLSQQYLNNTEIVQGYGKNGGDDFEYREVLKTDDK